ncbi:MAG TPA: SUMF1/EgtB/PvdO family nonheme iron enzyme, partial [Candidatus Wallbacteria bacterium]|nr:SUMF1/EgtB/PvdO family nonheme iron enzyme [Candidatus Wallbacteria bacterium]
MTSGTFLKAFGTAGTGDGQFQAPDGIAVDKYGAVYVTDFQNNTVQMFSSEGTFNKKWGGAGTGNGQFTSPHGICCDSNGHIFVSDKSCRIQKFSPAGDFVLGWGSSGSGDGQFTDPSGICSDSSGNIYVADCGNSRVQIFGPGTAPTPEKVATPNIVPAGGTFTVAQSVNLTCATSGATIKYTTDGTAPSVTNGSVHSSAITVSASATIKAMAYKTGMTDSDVASAAFVINSTTPQPGETLTIDLGGVTLKMVKIPAAGRSFLRGSPSSEKDRSTDEGPQHTVNFTKDYYIGKFEVTQSQWLKIYGRWPIVSISDGDDHPAYYVSWDHINGTDGFLEKINALKPGGYDGFRLPTEAEWEYAARAGTTTRFYWGDDLSYSEIGDYAWYTSNSQWAASPVGQKTANAFGLHDMSGNVSEWCSDIYGIYPEGTVTDPTGSLSGTSNRVYRGGWCEDEAKLCRSARRAFASPGSSMDTVGFRLALDASAVPASKVQTPSISPAGGTYTSAQSVTLTCATSGATIYYTTDGTTPSATNGTVYSSAISVTATKTIKAVAVKSGMTDSDAASAAYTIQTSSANKVKTPVISTVALSSYTIVDLNGYESGVTYYYTLDGTDPSASNGTVWGGKIYIEYTTTVKIVGVKTGYDNSDIATKVVSLPNSTALAGFQSVSGSPLGARQQACAVAHNGKLWVIGGYDSSTYKNDVWASTDGVTWSEATGLSLSKFNVRAHHTAMVFNNKI